MALNTRVAQRSILITPEGKHRLIHLRRVKHPESHQQVKILHRQPRDRLEQSKLLKKTG